MNKNSSGEVAFLLGSGVSIPAKLPSTSAITKKILSGEGIVRGYAENYFFADPHRFNYDPYQKFIPRIKIFLNVLRRELNDYYQDSIEPVNYEDIFYLLDFIRKNVYGAEKNPAFFDLKFSCLDITLRLWKKSANSGFWFINVSKSLVLAHSRNSLSKASALVLKASSVLILA